VLVYSLLLLFALQLISVYLVQSLEQYYLHNFKTGLEYQARLLASFLEPFLRDEPESSEDIANLVREFSGLRETEIAVLDSSAHICGSSKSQTQVGGRLIRDEVTRALAGEQGEAIRLDPAAGERRCYLAFPLKGGGDVNGVIYLSGSLKKVDTVLNQIKLILLSGSGLVLAISTLLGMVLARTITTPIQEVTRQAGLMARGDFSQVIRVKSGDEIGRLGASFNYLARRLDRNIKAISTEKSKIEAIINHMNDGVIALDGKGRLIHINPAAQALLDKFSQREEHSHRGRYGFSLLKSLVGAPPLRRFLRHREPLTLEVARDAPAVALKVTLAPFEEEEGRAEGTLVVLHDVTVERALIRQQQEFVADVSHELRTPLTTIKSYVETLLDGAAADPAIRSRFLNVLKRETDRMVDLVRDLLDLSGLGYSGAELQKSRVDLPTLAGEALEQLEQKGELKRSRIELALSPALPPLWADREKIMRVFLNLLSNAIRYTPADSKIRIGAAEGGEEGWVQVFIEDNGPGIPPADQERIFERFYRVEKTRSRDYGGTGLGLPIARRVIEAHGGKIGLESIEGVGTRAWFSLPAAAPQKGGGAGEGEG